MEQEAIPRLSSQMTKISSDVHASEPSQRATLDLQRRQGLIAKNENVQMPPAISVASARFVTENWYLQILELHGIGRVETLLLVLAQCSRRLDLKLLTDLTVHGYSTPATREVCERLVRILRATNFASFVRYYWHYLVSSASS